MISHIAQGGHGGVAQRGHVGGARRTAADAPDSYGLVFYQEKALVGAFSVFTNLHVDLRLKLYSSPSSVWTGLTWWQSTK